MKTATTTSMMKIIRNIVRAKKISNLSTYAGRNVILYRR